MGRGPGVFPPSPAGVIRWFSLAPGPLGSGSATASTGTRIKKGIERYQACPETEQPLIIAGEMAEELTDETGNNLMREIRERLKAPRFPH